MKQCLIVSGGYAPHRAPEAAQRVEQLLVSEGFAVRHADTLSVYEDEDLSLFDLIVPNWTAGSISVDAAKRLSATVASGTGLGGFHGGMADGFPSSDRFRYMVGGSYVAEPGGICRYRVEVVRRDDPLMAGIPDFDYESEQYYMHVDPAVDVLAVTRFHAAPHPWIDGVLMPSVWKKRFGEGRVFFSAFGHVPEEFDNPHMREILKRGLLWASRSH